MTLALHVTWGCSRVVSGLQDEGLLCLQHTGETGANADLQLSVAVA